MKKGLKLLLSAILTLSLVGCGSSPASDITTVKVGVVGEYNQQWDTINELLEGENIQVELVKFSDYKAPNRALNDGDIDMNAFQTQEYLDNEIESLGYDITGIGNTIIVPLALYNNKDKISSVEDIKDGDIIAIPSDLINGGRALKLLESAGLIECDPSKGATPTKADITKYNVNIEIKEAESGMLAKLLPDVTAAVINGGNAYTGGLSLKDDAIYVENVDPEVNERVSQLINVIAVRNEDKDNEVYQKIVAAYQTDEVANTIEESYQGAFICTWE